MERNNGQKLSYMMQNCKDKQKIDLLCFFFVGYFHNKITDSFFDVAKIILEGNN